MGWVKRIAFFPPFSVLYFLFSFSWFPLLVDLFSFFFFQSFFSRVVYEGTLCLYYFAKILVYCDQKFYGFFFEKMTAKISNKKGVIRNQKIKRLFYLILKIN